MIDLRTDGPDSGTVAIDFEDGNPPVVIARPKTGQVRRLDAERWRLLGSVTDYDAELQKREPPLSVVERVSLVKEKSYENTVAWWNLVLVGDDTFKRLATSDVPPSDEWPAYLVYGKDVIQVVLDHWTSTPLARGGKYVPAAPATNGQAQSETILSN